MEEEQPSEEGNLPCFDGQLEGNMSGGMEEMDNPAKFWKELHDMGRDTHNIYQDIYGPASDEDDSNWGSIPATPHTWKAHTRPPAGVQPESSRKDQGESRSKLLKLYYNCSKQIPEKGTVLEQN